MNGTLQGEVKTMKTVFLPYFPCILCSFLREIYHQYSHAAAIMILIIIRKCNDRQKCNIDNMGHNGWIKRKIYLNSYDLVSTQEKIIFHFMCLKRYMEEPTIGVFLECDNKYINIFNLKWRSQFIMNLHNFVLTKYSNSNIKIHLLT